jgi:15-cis-phytoene synthase
MSVDAAYAEVQRVTRARAKNFAYGIMVLPREKRRAIAAIYAFAREVDDVADGDLPAAEKRVRLEALRASLDAEPVGAMSVALHDARARYAIPRDALSALVDGGLQDLEQTRYATFDDLRGYCEQVAGAVGVACIAVYGSDDVERAMTLGIALQLINIMRDVEEDAELGRVYLPQDELDQFAVTELGRVTPAWEPFMAFQAQRARLRLDVRGPLPRAARPHGGERLRRLRRVVPALDRSEARRRRARAGAMRPRPGPGPITAPSCLRHGFVTKARSARRETA